LKRGKNKPFIGIERYRNKIAHDPVDPIFQFFPGHGPHTNKEDGRGKGIYIGNPPLKLIKELVYQKYKDKGGKKKE
jgi:hypothetical protein